MYELSSLFKPITVSALTNSPVYKEIEPCDILKPYVRCFWGSPLPYKNCKNDGDYSGLVIPDGCMDIIFDVDYSNEKVVNLFCGINDMPFCSNAEDNLNVISSFGIRFYFWSAYLFSDGDFNISCNEFSDVDRYFNGLRTELQNIVLTYPKIEDRIFYAQLLLIKKLHHGINENYNLLNSVYCILKSNGINTVSDVSKYTGISSRQIERIFREHIGISPKKCCSIVRYQNMWRDLVYGRCHDFNDITYKYGFSDQAHMINNFKKYHGSTPQQAVDFLKSRNEKMSHYYNTKI